MEARIVKVTDEEINNLGLGADVASYWLGRLHQAGIAAVPSDETIMGVKILDPWKAQRDAHELHTTVISYPSKAQS